MKKNVVIFCVSLTLCLILLPVLWSTYYSLIKGDKIHIYNRFYTTDGIHEQFNPWALVSPIQIEKQNIVNDTIRFKHKVIYPCSQNYLGIGENFISDEISKFISDSVVRIEIKNKMDFDCTSYGVREYKNPEIRRVNKPYVSNLSLIGTTSPEWNSYGFKKSIQPGHIEKENLRLAKERLFNISKILEKNGFTINRKRITEIQLSKESVKAVLKDKNILSEMRYVEARGNIIVEKVKITTIILPFIMIPLWFLLLYLSFLGYIKLFRLIKFDLKNFLFSIGKIIIPILIIIGALIVLALFIFAIINGLFLPLIFVIVIMSLLFFREKIINFLLINIGFIIFSIERFCNWVHKKFGIFKVWWKSKNTSDKILYFLIPYSIVVTILAIYLLLVK